MRRPSQPCGTWTVALVPDVADVVVERRLDHHVVEGRRAPASGSGSRSGPRHHPSLPPDARRRRRRSPTPRRGASPRGTRCPAVAASGVTPTGRPRRARPTARSSATSAASSSRRRPSATSPARKPASTRRTMSWRAGMVSSDRASSLNPTVLAKPAGLGDQTAEPADALGAVVEPPRRAEAQRRVVAGQRRQLPAVGALVERVDDDRQRRLVAEAVEQRLERPDVVHRLSGCRRPCRGRSGRRASGCGPATSRSGAGARARRPGSWPPSRPGAGPGSARRRRARPRPCAPGRRAPRPRRGAGRR